jgi:hypothetical protein
MKMKKYTNLFIFILILLTGLCPQVKAYDTYSLFDNMYNSTLIAQRKAIFKKTFSTLNQALMMGEALNDKLYSNFNDVWNIGIKEQLLNPKDITNGVILADSTYVTYSKTGKPCTKAPENEDYASKNTACAVLTIDTNGNKEPNALSTKQKINDRYTVLLYSNRVLTIPNYVEWSLLNEYKKRRY